MPLSMKRIGEEGEVWDTKSQNVGQLYLYTLLTIKGGLLYSVATDIYM